MSKKRKNNQKLKRFLAGILATMTLSTSIVTPVYADATSFLSGIGNIFTDIFTGKIGEAYYDEIHDEDGTLNTNILTTGAATAYIKQKEKQKTSEIVNTVGTDTESATEDEATAKIDQGTKLEGKLATALNLYEKDRYVKLNTSGGTLELNSKNSYNHDEPPENFGITDFFEGRGVTVSDDLEVGENEKGSGRNTASLFALKSGDTASTANYAMKLTYEDYLFESGYVVRKWTADNDTGTGTMEIDGKSPQKTHSWLEYGAYTSFRDPEAEGEEGGGTDTTQWVGSGSVAGAATLSNVSDIKTVTYEITDSDAIAEFEEILKSQEDSNLASKLKFTWAFSSSGAKVNIKCDENLYDGADEATKKFLDTIRAHKSLNTNEDVDEEDEVAAGGTSSSDNVESGEKEDIYEYTYLNKLEETEIFKNQNHWVAFNSNLIINEFVLPMEHSLRDVLQNQNVYNGVKNLEDYLFHKVDSLDNNANGMGSLTGLDAGGNYEGAGVDGSSAYGILDASGNLAPIYATQLYYSSGNSLIPAKVRDLFDITQTNNNKYFVIRYRAYNQAKTDALGEGAAPQYDINTHRVYKFDFYTYEYMALASIIDPDLQTNLEGFSNHYVSIDMYGNIILASSESDASAVGKIVIPAIANSYFVNNVDASLQKNSAASLFNRIFVAGYDFTTSNTLLEKSEKEVKKDANGEAIGVTPRVQKSDFTNAIKANIWGKNKFFMVQNDDLFNVKKGIKVEDQADKNTWDLFLHNLKPFYGNMIDVELEVSDKQKEDAEKEAEKAMKTAAEQKAKEEGEERTVDEIIEEYKNNGKDKEFYDAVVNAKFCEQYLGGLSTITYGTSRKQGGRWKYSARINGIESTVDGLYGADARETFNYIFGDWTKYQSSVQSAGGIVESYTGELKNNSTSGAYLTQIIFEVQSGWGGKTVTAFDMYVLNPGYFLEHVDSLAKASVNKDSWLQSITPTEFAAWFTVVNRFLTRSGGPDASNSRNVDNEVLTQYCSYKSEDELKTYAEDESLVCNGEGAVSSTGTSTDTEDTSTDAEDTNTEDTDTDSDTATSDGEIPARGTSFNNYAYTITKDSYLGTFIRSWDLDGFVKLDAGGLVYLNDDDQTSLETNEERSSNILFYMNKILGDLGSSLTDITAMRLSHEYRSIESASILNLIFQIDNFLEDRFVMKILQFYFFLVIFLNTLWFITRIINLFSETEDAITTYVIDMLKSIALSTVPIILLMLFTYVANWSTSLIFTKTFMYWTGIRLDSLNIANVDEDSFTTDLEHFLQITAPQEYEEDYVQLPYLKSDATLKNGKYEVSKISLNDLRNNIARGNIDETTMSSYDGEMSYREVKENLMANKERYSENLFYYFYDVLRVHYFNYYNSQGKADTFYLYSKSSTSSADAGDEYKSAVKGRFADLNNGMSATAGTVLDMFNDPIFLFGQSYLDNKDELGDFKEAQDKYLKELKVQDICDFTDLMSASNTSLGALSEYVDIPRNDSVRSTTWFMLLNNSSLVTDKVLNVSSNSQNPFDTDNYGNGIFGIDGEKGVILGSELLYPDKYEPTLVERKLNDINKQVAKDLIQLNDYKGFTDETIMQLAALTMTIDFNRMMTSEFKPTQSLQPTSLYGKSYGMDTIFTSIYVENSSSLRDVVGQDMIMYTKNKGGFFAQILLIITLVVGQIAGLLKYVLILFILGLSMFTFLVVYNFAKDFYSEAWLGLATLYLMQLGIHVLFLVALAALCIPKTAEVSTSIFQGYSGTIKLAVLLVLFLLQIFAFSKIAIFAAKNYYTLGGDIVKAKFNEMSSAFNNLIAGKGFQATSDNTEYSSDNTTVKSDKTDTEVSEADITAGNTQIDDVGQARAAGEMAISKMQMDDARAEVEAVAAKSTSTETQQLDTDLNVDKAKIEKGLERSYVAGISYEELLAATGHDEKLDLAYDNSLWTNEEEMFKTAKELESDPTTANLAVSLAEYQETATPEGFLKSEGLDNIPKEVKGSDEEYYRYMQSLSPEEKYQANMQRAAYMLQQQGQFSNIQKDAIAKYGKDTYGAAKVASEQYRDSLQKAYSSVVNTMSNATAKEALERLYSDNNSNTSSTVVSNMNNSDTQAEAFKETHTVVKEDSITSTQLKNADSTVNDTVSKYSKGSESQFSAFDEFSDFENDEDEEDWDDALQAETVQQETIQKPSETSKKQKSKSKRLADIGDAYERESMFATDEVSSDPVLNYFNTKGGKLEGYNPIALSMDSGDIHEDSTGYQCYTKSDPNSTGDMEIYPSSLVKSPQMQRYYKGLFDFNGSGSTVMEIKPSKVIRNAYGNYDVVEKGSITFK